MIFPSFLLFILSIAILFCNIFLLNNYGDFDFSVLYITPELTGTAFRVRCSDWMNEAATRQKKQN